MIRRDPRGRASPARSRRGVGATSAPTAHARRGQATTEYVLLIAFLVVALLVAGYAFLPGFSQGMDGVEDDASSLIGAGTADGSGNKR